MNRRLFRCSSMKNAAGNGTLSTGFFHKNIDDTNSIADCDSRKICS